MSELNFKELLKLAAESTNWEQDFIDNRQNSATPEEAKLLQQHTSDNGAGGMMSDFGDSISGFAGDAYDLASSIGNATKNKLVDLKNREIDQPMQQYFKEEFGNDFVSPEQVKGIDKNVDHLDRLQFNNMGEVSSRPYHDASALVRGREPSQNFNERYIEPIAKTEKIRQEQVFKDLGEMIRNRATPDELRARVDTYKNDAMDYEALNRGRMGALGRVHSDADLSEMERERLRLLRRLGLV